MNPFILRLLCSKRRLLIGSSSTLLYSIKTKTIYACDEKTEALKVKILEENRPVRWNLKSGIVEIIRILRMHLMLSLAATGTALCAAIMSILSPIYVSRLVDEILASFTGTVESFNIIGSTGVLLGISLANAVMTALYIKLIGDLGEAVAREMRVDLFQKILHESVTFFDDKDVGELLTILTVDVQSFKHALKQILTTGIKSGVQLAASSVQIYLISKSLTLTLGASLPLMFLVGDSYGRFLRNIAASVREAESAVNGQAHEALSNIRTVKLFSAEDYEVDKYQKSVEIYSSKQKWLLGHVGIFQGLTTFSMNSFVAAVLFLGGKEVVNGNLTGGGLLAYLMSLQTAQKALTSLVTLNAKFYSMLNDLARIKASIKQEFKEEDLSELRKIKNFSSEIKLNNLTFSHRERENVFDAANIEIGANKVIGIIGDSGSGKSTLISLLCRFYEPEAGEIMIGGVKSTELDLKFIRKQFGIVPQEPVLFNGTIYENIAYPSDGGFDKESVEAAAKRAHIHEFIEEQLPMGYATPLNKCSLSGGQKQRIALARALLRKPRILILDEATSALDRKSEDAVHETLQEIIKERRTTVIIITHKREILKMADQVYELKNGKFQICKIQL